MPPVLGPAFAVEDPLEVLRGQQRYDGAAVAEARTATPRARRGTPRSRPVPHAAAWASAASRSAVTDDALAGGEAVVLDDVRRSERVERRGRLLRRCGTAARRPSGTPAAVITSLAKALEPSSRAASPDGPKHAMPAARDGVGHPRHQRRLGADDDQVGPELDGQRGDRRAGRAGRRRGGWPPPRCPGLPGAACTSVTSGSRARARARACSRPPVPMTRAIISRFRGVASRAVSLVTRHGPRLSPGGLPWVRRAARGACRCGGRSTRRTPSGGSAGSGRRRAGCRGRGGSGRRPRCRPRPRRRPRAW